MGGRAALRGATFARWRFECCSFTMALTVLDFLLIEFLDSILHLV